MTGVAIVAGFAGLAAAGAVLRWGAAVLLGGRLAATLIVNVVASFAAGLAAGTESDTVRLLASTALLGSLSTFSTVVREVVALWRTGERRTAVGYAVATLGLGVAAASVGLALG